MNYGNNVWYFPYTQYEFANGLSSFLKNHPNLEVAAMAGAGTGPTYGEQGYFVVLRKKK